MLATGKGMSLRCAPAEGSCLVDSTEMSVDEVVSMIMERIPADWNPGTDSSIE